MEDNFTQKFFAIRYKDEKKRQQSQSGGAFSAAAESVLSKQGIVYGVSQKSDLDIVYERIEKSKDLKRLKGSKYTQAKPATCFEDVKKDLMEEKLVLFSGTPCLVSALLIYLQKQGCSLKKLITCDLICHGVARPQIYRDYIRELQSLCGKKKVKRFIFRDKRFGWRNNISSYCYGKKTMMTSNYINIYESQYVLGQACFSCKYASTDRVADMTVGDYWGIEKILPEYDDNTGVSLLMINTPKGETVFEDFKDVCEYEQTSVEACRQPNLMQPTPKPDKYEDFWKDYAEKGFLYTVTKYCNYNPENDWEYLEKRSYWRRLKRKLKSLSGQKS